MVWPQRSNRKKTILIIEDKQELREEISETLKFEGYQVMETSSGAEGIRLAAQLLPDVILCDIMMPEPDGFVVLSQLKENLKTAMIPFIYITALSDRADIRKGMELGADDYLIKPFSREELLNSIFTQIAKFNKFEMISTELLNQVKANIIKSIPHEFRTSLNIILGMSGMIRSNADSLTTDEIAELGDSIYESCQNLSSIVTKYLIFVELELSDTKRSTKVVDNIGELTEKTANRISAAYSRQHDLVLNPTVCKLQINPELFQFVLDELIDNAFKFSSAGTDVNIDTINYKNQVEFIIQDHGRGISEDQINSISAFMQFDRKIFEQQGIGLGLYLSKRIIEQYGGSFSIKSAPNTGTTICFLLPGVTNRTGTIKMMRSNRRNIKK
ncbi:hybrid sensor histidine kinase/response regulator [Gaoshiqia sp. Z1-71]|uniref:hybrid sensor histidine kinase/response regulator n=1 Tax=Gaoshiqia hydrogeniformans TaxID=3290090 RepID=UPI003BF84C77